MSYLDLLKLAAPEAIVTLTALVVLVIGLTTSRGTAVAGVSVAMPQRGAAGTAAATAFCTLVAAFGLVIAIEAILLLPSHANLFHGMLVISPLNSLFQIVCLVLAFFTVLLAPREIPNYGEYLAIVLLATIGLLLLVSSEELLMIFIGLELTGLSLYLMTAFDKTDIRSAEAGLKYFLFGSTASAFTLFGLSFIYGMAGTTSLAAIAEGLACAISLAPFVRRDRHDSCRLRFQNRRCALSSLGAGRLSRRAGFERRLHCIRIKSGLVRCPWKNSARRVWPGSR